MARLELQIYGDESKAPGTVTYGLVTFRDAQHAKRTSYGWNSVIKKFGAPSRTNVHARVLFHGHARQKSEWSHLSEQQASNLAIELITVLRQEQAIFCVGVVRLDTFPPEGVPDALDELGNQRFIQRGFQEYCSMGFAAAIGGLKHHKILEPGTPHKLFLDPMSTTIKMFSDHPGTQLSSLVQGLGVQPTKFAEQPQLLDAADLFAYAAGRALSKEQARNKDVCITIYNATNCIKLDCVWPFRSDGSRHNMYLPSPG